jgi:hypothetical protein
MSGCWAALIDNVSRIPPWFSDALCKAVSGDGLVRRRLYSDGDLSVVTFRRVICMTSIDAGALRGDLGDRLLLVDLERIEASKRRSKLELRQRFEALQPRLLGALLDLVVDVLQLLPGVELPEMPRMADFARVFAALDKRDGSVGRAALLYGDQRDRIAAEVVESDSIGPALLAFLEEHDGWEGTAGELLDRLSNVPPPRGWPPNARAMSGALKRLRPALLQLGWEATPPTTKYSRIWLISRRKSGPQTNADGSRGAQNGTVDVAAHGSNGWNGCSQPFSVSPLRTRCEVRSRAAALIRGARRHGDRHKAGALREAWLERVAICSLDADLSLEDAERVALAEIEAHMLANGQV